VRYGDRKKVTAAQFCTEAGLTVDSILGEETS
jgi:hypothetical protein